MASPRATLTPLTDAVTSPSGLVVSIAGTGAPLGPEALRVHIHVATAASLGDKRIVLKRPAVGGTDTHTMLVAVIP